MSAGDRSQVTFQPGDKLGKMTVEQLQALIESKTLAARVSSRYAIIGAGVALTVAVLAFIVAVTR